MKAIQIDHNPRASNNVVPYHIGEVVNGKYHWREKTYTSLALAEDAAYTIYGKNIVITHN